MAEQNQRAIEALEQEQSEPFLLVLDEHQGGPRTMAAGEPLETVELLGVQIASLSRALQVPPGDLIATAMKAADRYEVAESSTARID